MPISPPLSRGAAKFEQRHRLFDEKKQNHSHLWDSCSEKSNHIEVRSTTGEISSYTAPHIILATGARSREIPQMSLNGTSIIGYREALSLKKQPKRLLVVGSGAIGMEFAYFYHSLGTRVEVVELENRILPQEDAEVSAYMKSHFQKQGMLIRIASWRGCMHRCTATRCCQLAQYRRIGTGKSGHTVG